MSPSPGDLESIGGYALVERLGSGGMGVVYLGRSDSGRRVAVKVVHAQYAQDEEFRTRFRQEVAAVRRVSGAFTAPVVDADPDAERPWMATLYVPGRTLADRVNTDGPLRGGQLRVLALGLVEALRDIHRVGVVHRDLKPSNVLMAEDGPRVIDFGISHAVDNQALTVTGRLIGTPPFMSPEQFASPRDVTAASDVFSLGSLLVYAATGSRPFDGSSPYLTGYQVMYEAPALDAVAEPLRSIAERCLDKDPAARPELAELQRLLRTLPGAAEPEGPGVPGVAGVAGVSGVPGAPGVPGAADSAGTSHQVSHPHSVPPGLLTAGGAGEADNTHPGHQRRGRRITVSLAAAVVVVGLTVATVRTGWSDENDTSRPPTTPAAAPAVTPPPKHVRWDYQVGGAYTPPTGVQVVSRSHEDAPAPGVYNICNFNAFQAQEDAEGDWDPDLLLRDANGKVVYDKDWGEAVLDIRTAAKRKRIAAEVIAWIDQCAAKGYQAVEPDNYDTFTRFPNYLTANQAKAFMKLLSVHAHGKGLAIAQKNTLELVPDRASVGLDFAVVEECGEWNECGEFAEAFDNNVLVVEYTAKGLSTVCADWSTTLSVVRRDQLVLPKDTNGYLRKTC
ncbi:endo alpha-1,4 polygalactosaminidase [Streptomyces sp. NPDC087263]|uniref:endo alpha-1,4 polygalactosaminidase n=1 Tax=Streptomyces sp. NPDC087263 TaxID=3365773 RepID=UPI0038079913